jgi:poly(A) polymerase
MAADSPSTNAVPAAGQPAGKLAPQPWMTAPESRRVLEALGASGLPVRFIGGCVRDALAHRKVQDIDLALALPPKEVMALLERAGIAVVPTGIDHGTVTAIVDGRTFEITTLRVDVESFGRRARVAFTDDWVADAARRDLTINALSCTPDGDVYDYFNGIEDLGRGRVRFVGNAHDRIGEDVLRLLRFFRFHAHYGRPPPDAEALAACRAWADKLNLLSGERVRVEIFRTLMAPQPADVFRLMAEHHVLPHALPEAGQFGRLQQLAWLEQSGLARAEVQPDPVRRLAALLATDAAGAEAVAQRLRLSNRQRDRLLTMVAPPCAVAPPAGDVGDGGDHRPLLRALYHCGRETVRDLILLAWAGDRAEASRLPPGRSQAWLALIDRAAALPCPAFPLRGRDALALGIPPGPQIGRLLGQVEAWWEQGGYQAGRAACLERLGRVAGGEGVPQA